MINFLKNRKEKIIDVIRFVIVVACISFFSLLPYHNNVLPFGHDLGYHLNRINEISNGLNVHKFPVLIHAGLLDGLGYGNGLFYPQIFLYFPAILISFFGFQLLPAYKVFLFFITFFTFISMYYSTKLIFKKKDVAFFSSLLYIFSLWRIVDIFLRGAVGEILAFAFVPLIFAGLYNVIYDKDDKWYVIVLGLAGLSYTHLLSFIITVAFIGIVVLFSVDKVFKDKKVFINLLIAAVFSALISIGFFGPMIEQKLNDIYNVDGRTTVTSEFINSRALSPRMALSNRFSYGYAENSMERQDGMTESVGTLVILFAALFLFRKGISLKENRFEFILFILGSLTLLFTTSIIPWDKLSFLNVIQYPFRFNFIIILFFSFVGANSLYEILDENTRRNIMILISIIFVVFQVYVISGIDVNFNETIKTYDDLVGTMDGQVGFAEYLPDGTYIWDLDLYNINDKESKVEFDKVGSIITFDWDRSDIDFYFNLPLVYYKGYKASIISQDGTKKQLEVVEHDNKHVAVKSDERLTGKVVVEYKLTAVQISSYVVAIVYAVIVKIIVTRKLIKERKMA